MTPPPPDKGKRLDVTPEAPAALEHAGTTRQLPVTKVNTFKCGLDLIPLLFSSSVEHRGCVLHTRLSVRVWVLMSS